MVFQNSTSYSSNKTSLFESPIYERSQENRDLCLRFRYRICGPGRQFLRLYHQFDLRNHTRRLMWVVNETSNANQWWKYGSVALPGGAKFRVFMHFFPKLEAVVNFIFKVLWRLFYFSQMCYSDSAFSRKVEHNGAFKNHFELRRVDLLGKRSFWQSGAIIIHLQLQKSGRKLKKIQNLLPKLIHENQNIFQIEKSHSA